MAGWLVDGWMACQRVGSGWWMGWWLVKGLVVAGGWVDGLSKGW